ncbi:sigma-70 family RNA polymerase sigma factor [Streptomyces sp. B3I8]|uniref:sigma-70 family RNA polymerase sigma factor n=1 Tax=Streptomyces sp. B3I8 TaxID=3042303 RepID=UPI0027807647|nr:sigma-70 family RNA polymerase sigma factor [Streptomyces sp. B3I8]MDQ0784999.1 RNA polymerase sigma factor (sigma-70 family) [Streptomyces sp. B3I8]
MPTDHGSDPGTGLVSAACAGDPRAVEGLVTQSLPLVYNIVGRALDGGQDVDDVVQETLLRVVRGLDGLENPSSYRSWMVAITVRQIRDWIRGRVQDREAREPVELAARFPDPASDFASLTVLRLQLDSDRREVAEATRWLDEDQRELLSLWWLEETGELARAEVCEALGLSGRHTAVRVQRLKEQLDVARTVVRVLAARPACPELSGLTEGWDAVPSPLWRKRIARHTRGCAHCGTRTDRLVPVGRLLLGLPLLVPPPGLRQAVWAAIAPALPAADTRPDGVTETGAPGSAGPRPRGTHAAGRTASRRRASRRAGHARTVTAAVATATVVLGAFALAHYRDTDRTVSSPAGAPTASGAGTTAGATASASPSPGPSAKNKEKKGKEKDEKGEGEKKPGASASAGTARASRAAGGETAADPVVSSRRKGVGVWSFPGMSDALGRSGAGWYYTWSTAHPGITASGGADFVPMVWGAKSVTTQALAEAKAAGPYLLGFNEPDMSAQSNMTVDQALDLWPKLQATGATLGSPAVAYGGDRAGGWLDRFMSGAKQRGYRVDFVALHWYGGDFRTAAAVDQLRGYLSAVYARYHKPIWLTEFALIDFSQGTRYPTDTEQAAFLTSATKMLAGLPYVRRYAWFGLGTDDAGPGTTLFRSGSTLTAEGRAFRSAP